MNKSLFILALLCLLMAVPMTANAIGTNLCIPYFYIDGNTDATLNLSQVYEVMESAGGTPHVIPVVVEIRLGTATSPTVSLPVNVQPHGTTSIALKPYLPISHAVMAGAGWGNGKLANAAWGSIIVKISPTYSEPEEIDAIDAEVAVTGIFGTDRITASDTARKGGTYQGIVARKRTPSARIYVVTQNATSTGTTAYISLNNAGYFASPWIPAHSAVMIEITGQIGTSTAEVEITSAVNLIGTVQSVDDNLMIAITQPMLSAVNKAGDSQTPPFPYTSDWVGTVSLANTSGTGANVFPSWHYYNSSGVKQQINGSAIYIPARTGVSYSFASLGAPTTPSLSLSIQSSRTISGSIDLMNTTNFRLAMAIPFVQPGGGSNEKSAVGMYLGMGADDATTMIGGSNIDTVDSTTVFLSISYIDPLTGVGKRYLSPTTILGPQGGKLYDIRYLRDNAIPDVTGAILPSSLQSGSAHIWSSNPSLAGQDATYSKFGGWAYQCESRCGGYVGAEESTMSPRFCHVKPTDELFGFHYKAYTQTYALVSGPYGSDIFRFKACPPITKCGRTGDLFYRGLSSGLIVYWHEFLLFPHLFPNLPLCLADDEHVALLGVPPC